MIENLSIVSWDFLGGLGAAAITCWIGWRSLRQRRHRSVALAALVAAVLLSSACAASAVNRHFSYLPRFADVVSVVDGGRDWTRYADIARLDPAGALSRYPHGVVVRFGVADHGSGFGPSRALAYLPPQYFAEPDRRFAVAYLFHGSPGVPGDWFHGGEAAVVGRALAARGEPVILVAPRMSAGWLDDPECVDGVKERIETHFRTDVVPAVDATLRTVPARDARALVGMSAGGYCALNLGLRNRGLASTIIDMSGFTHPTHDGGLAQIFGTGPDAPELARANSPDEYARELPATPATRVWFDCGRHDEKVLGELAALAGTLRSDGIEVRTVSRPGGHTFGVWRPALSDSMAWAAPRLVSAAEPPAR